MERYKEVKISLSWNFDGSFSAELTNGNITSLNMCELGGNGCEGKCLTSTDLKFLQNVHQALGELFKQIEEENKANGYSFPTKLDDE